MGLKPISSKDETPLWLYILKEAETVGKGIQLGPVGAQLVAETFVGLLAADRASYYSVAPGWQPSHEAKPIPVLGGGFQLRDIVRYSGALIGEVPPK
jgi:hypothetical protein